jgi:hypothetical protein
MVDLNWWRTFFLLMVAVGVVLKLVAGSSIPSGIVFIPLILFIGTMLIGSKS